MAGEVIDVRSRLVRSFTKKRGGRRNHDPFVDQRDARAHSRLMADFVLAPLDAWAAWCDQRWGTDRLLSLVPNDMLQRMGAVMVRIDQRMHDHMLGVVDQAAYDEIVEKGMALFGYEFFNKKTKKPTKAVEHQYGHFLVTECDRINLDHLNYDVHIAVRGWQAMDRFATEAGHQPMPLEVWHCHASGGRAVAVVRDVAQTDAVRAYLGDDYHILTMDEVSRLASLPGMHLVERAKQIFGGAEIAGVGPTVSEMASGKAEMKPANLDDEIPF